MGHLMAPDADYERIIAAALIEFQPDGTPASFEQAAGHVLHRLERAGYEVRLIDGEAGENGS